MESIGGAISSPALSGYESLFSQEVEIRAQQAQRRLYQQALSLAQRPQILGRIVQASHTDDNLLLLIEEGA